MKMCWRSLLPPDAVRLPKCRTTPRRWPALRAAETTLVLLLHLVLHHSPSSLRRKAAGCGDANDGLGFGAQCPPYLHAVSSSPPCRSPPSTLAWRTVHLLVGSLGFGRGHGCRPDQLAGGGVGGGGQVGVGGLLL